MKKILTVLILFLTVTTACAAEAPVLFLHGQVRQGEMLFGYVSPGAQITVNDERITPRKDGWFSVGIGRDDTGNLTFKAIKDGEQTERSYKITPRKWRVQRIDGLPQNTVTPTEEEEQRIAAEMVLAKEARQKALIRKCLFVFPCLRKAASPAFTDLSGF